MTCTSDVILQFLLFLIGYESDGQYKPVPGKALLPVLDVFDGVSPTPPPGPPPPEAYKPISQFRITLYNNIRIYIYMYMYVQSLYMHCIIV